MTGNRPTSPCPESKQTWTVHRKHIDEHGFSVVPAVFSAAAVETMRTELEQSLQAPAATSTIQSEAGTIYAARNILTMWPDAATVWQQPPQEVAIDALHHAVYAGATSAAYAALA